MKIFLMIYLMVFMASCAHVNSVSQTSIPRNKSKVVTASVERNIIFLMNFDNKYIDTLTEDLIRQCPRGSIKGILTKDETITYFPIVFQKSDAWAHR